MGIEKGIYRRLLLDATDGYTYTSIAHLHRRLLCFPLCRGRSSRWQFSSDKLTEELNANQVKWADEYDGYGEHYYEYNHGHHEPEKGYPAPAYHEPAKGYSEPAPVYESGPAPPKYWNHTPKNNQTATATSMTTVVWTARLADVAVAGALAIATTDDVCWTRVFKRQHFLYLFNRLLCIIFSLTIGLCVTACRINRW